MSKPRLLDLFCGAGGAAMGYARAGFEVVGVDIQPQPRYPFTFVQADALDFLGWLIQSGDIRQFAAVHASPPCQHATSLRALHPDKEYPALIEPTRDLLLRCGVPWVIENVMPAKLAHGITLCGNSFGLRVYRHRRFETSWLAWPAPHQRHIKRCGSGKGQIQRKAAYLAGGFVTVSGNVGSYAGEAMGIDWMTGAELSQAIPPAYTEWIGRQLMAVIEQESADILSLMPVEAAPA